ncbi:hypothetical protein AGMMS49975_09280 [Clostridia bacterium]|nr:hypothetical protein AGMMS49975_09280 [Clostridia bacterium]
MIAVNYSYARENFKRFCDAAVHENETVIVTRKQGENVVILSETEYNNLTKDVYVRFNQEDYNLLLTAINRQKTENT